ncbi:MAG: response regulator [Candidatus Lokiarchaeota archaeon]|nr:response regulator [Candidatus Lokiarchaeota archaeon]
MPNEKKNGSSNSNSKENHISPKMTDEEISKLDLNSEQAKKLMRAYEETTDKYANWRGNVTEGFMKWLKGEKIYDREKERISLYVADKTKEEWNEFIKTHKAEYNTISKLIRKSVNYFIKQKSTLIKDDLHKVDNKTLTNISHALKEPLTSIKGFSQLLIENYRDEMEENVFSTIQNIFNQSLLLEKKIINILDNIKTETSQYDILLIEDDLATIRLLTSYFESKGFSCKGVVSGAKGLEEISNNPPKLVLLDIILPDYSGYDICKQIKSNKEFQDISVYLLTAIPGSEVEKHLKESIADGYILKPFDFSDFEVIFQYL